MDVLHVPIYKSHVGRRTWKARRSQFLQSHTPLPQRLECQFHKQGLRLSGEKFNYRIPVNIPCN